MIDIDPTRERSLKTIGHISYLLHADRRGRRGAAGRAGQRAAAADRASSSTCVKRDDARGTWQESHFSWRIRSVLWAGGLYLRHVAAVAAVLPPGWIAWALISIWFLYRIVRGWLNLNDDKPMPMPT